MDDGFFSGLEFKGFFFMDFIEKTLSFEQMLFDSLAGGRWRRRVGPSTSSRSGTSTTLNSCSTRSST